MADEQRWQEQLEVALEEHEKEGAEAQVDAVKRILLAEPSPETTDELWKKVVCGLLILIAISLLGLIVLLLADKDSQIVLTAFSALLAGLLGLFVPSPTER